MKVLLTGGTGFLGQYLMHELLDRGHTVWAIYRDQSSVKTAERFLDESSIRHGIKNLHWFEGDILDASIQWEEWCNAYEGLQGVDHLLHNAASLRFRLNEAGEPFRTNVGGARALRDLVERRPMNVHVVSTAFVCGFVGDGVVYETEHPRGNFLNDYEQSKWEAEQIWMGKATILRPSVIVGHSQTGRCTSFTGFYIVAKALHLLDQVVDHMPDCDRNDLELNIPADPNGTANFVPVDYVAKAAIKILEDRTLHGKIFHLTHPNPPIHLWFHELLCRRFNIGGLRFVGKDVPLGQPRNELQRQVVKQVGKFLPYFSNNPIFDRSNTDAGLPNLELPPISETLIERLIDYAIEVDWGQSQQL
jgi:nucleoside-diphosphate-sugar epimerase